MNITNVLQRLVTGSILRTLNLVLSVGIAFFLLPFLVHNLGTYEYGLWVIVGTVAGSYGLLDFGLSTAVGRYLAKSRAENNISDINTTVCSAFVVYSVLALIVLFISGIGSFVSLFLIGDENLTSSFALSLFILGASVAIQFPIRSFGGILYASFRYDLSTYVGVITTIIRTTLIFSLISKGYGILTLSIITFISNLVGYFLEFYFVKKIFPELVIHAKHISKERIKELYHYSKVAFASNISEMMRLRTIPFILSTVLGASSVTVFAISQRLVEYIELLITTLTKLLTPIFSSHGTFNKQVEKALFTSTAVITIIVTYVMLSTFFYGATFIKIWMGDEFSDSYTILSIMLIGFSVVLIHSPMKEMLYGISKHKYCAYTHSLQLALITTFATIGVILNDLVGLAYGITVGMVFPEFIVPVVLSKLTDKPIYKIYFNHILLVAAKVCVTLGLFFITMNPYLEHTYTSLVVLNTFQVLYFVPIFWFFILPEEPRRVLSLTFRAKHL